MSQYGKLLSLSNDTGTGTIVDDTSGRIVTFLFMDVRGLTQPQLVSEPPTSSVGLRP